MIEKIRVSLLEDAFPVQAVKRLDKIAKIELPRTRRVVRFDFRDPPRSGVDAAALAGISKRFGPRVLYDGFDMMFRRGERWCVMGKNGAGKTTLLKMVVGALDPDAGMVRLGASISGPGVPEELLTKIFQPFFRVDDSRDSSTGGVGLGLAIARHAIDVHNGRLWAENVHPGLMGNGYVRRIANISLKRRIGPSDGILIDHGSEFRPGNDFIAIINGKKLVRKYLCQNGAIPPFIRRRIRAFHISNSGTCLALWSSRCL
jgi:energy-coupling factor transporter ATP-binding protein EcfA2